MTHKVHEHIIRIADKDISRRALFRGLEASARHPERYTEHMDGARILSESKIDGGLMLRREIDFGSFALRDCVLLREPDSVLTLVEAGRTWPASSLLMKIEEPEPGSLFVRFLYEEEEGKDGSGENPALSSLRKKAYEAKDRYLIERILEEIARSGSRD